MTHDINQKIRDFTQDVTGILLDAGLAVDINPVSFEIESTYLLKNSTKSRALEVLQALYDVIQHQLQDEATREKVSQIVDDYIYYISKKSEVELRLTH